MKRYHKVQRGSSKGSVNGVLEIMPAMGRVMSHTTCKIASMKRDLRGAASGRENVRNRV